jgi:CHAT domain-containing protein
MFRVTIFLALAGLAGPASSQGTTAPRPRTVADINSLLDQFKPEPGKATASSAILARTIPATASRTDQVRHYSERAAAAAALGQTQELLESRRKLVELTASDANHSRYLQDLASAEAVAGNQVEAIRLRELAVKNVSISSGQELSIYFALARSYALVGELATARSYIARGDLLVERTRRDPRAAPFIPTWLANREWSIAEIAVAAGKFADAEAAQRRSSQFWARYMESAERLYRSEPTAPSPETIRGGLAFSDLNLTRHLVRLGRVAEAEVTVRNVLRQSLSEGGKYTPRTGVALTSLAEVLSAQGRHIEAISMAKAAEDVFDRAGVVEGSIFRMGSMTQLGEAQFGMGLWAESRATWAGLRAAAARDAVSARSFRHNPVEVATLLMNGDAATALSLSDAFLKEVSANFGVDHPRTSLVRGLNASALAALGRNELALDAFGRALPALLAPSGQEQNSSALARRMARIVLEAYIGLLHALRDTDLLRQRGVDAVADSFRIADALRAGSVQQSLAASAARAAGGQHELGELIRKEQDLQQELAALYDFLLRMMTTPAEQQLPKVLADMKGRIEAIGKERSQLSADIVKRFPEYSNLIAPRPATIEDARKALRAGESLVSVLTTSDRSYVWAVDAQGKVGLHAAPLGDKALAGMVATLRKALDPGNADLIPPFDVITAHRLYSELLAPLAPVWGGAQTLVVVASGALAQLPVSVLPTSPAALPRDDAQLFSGYRKVDWLARKVAVAYAPSVTAFARLRALPAPGAQRSPFAGFGDPVFGGKQVAAATSTRGIKLRNLQISRVTEQTAATSTASAAWSDYAQLTPLPDTRDEINAIATALGANPQTDVFLGPDASRLKVKQTDLSRRRIVAFATHGLIPGDLPDLDQPALALSVTADGKESPLLTLEDVLGLKLDADWVVLSACNTAAGDGQGAEAVSGLGRGFFYAGTRALLVTHWPVETVSARLLTTGIFERYAKEPATSRAQAVNASMLALIDSPGTAQFAYAHPLFWAPYALIGDAGR